MMLRRYALTTHSESQGGMVSDVLGCQIRAVIEPKSRVANFDVWGLLRRQWTVDTVDTTIPVRLIGLTIGLTVLGLSTIVDMDLGIDLLLDGLATQTLRDLFHLISSHFICGTCDCLSKFPIFLEIQGNCLCTSSSFYMVLQVVYESALIKRYKQACLSFWSCFHFTFSWGSCPRRVRNSATSSCWETIRAGKRIFLMEKMLLESPALAMA